MPPRTPRWSKWAATITHWSRSYGSEPRSIAPTLRPIRVPGSLPGIDWVYSPLEQPLELEPSKLVDQVGRGLLPPCPAPAAELGRGQRSPRPRAAGLAPGAAEAGDILRRRQAGQDHESDTAASRAVDSDPPRRTGSVAGSACAPADRHRPVGICCFRHDSSSWPGENSGIPPHGRRIVWHITHGLGTDPLHGGVLCRASSWIKVMALTLAVVGVRRGQVGQGSGLDRLSPLAVRPAPSPGQRLRV